MRFNSCKNLNLLLLIMADNVGKTLGAFSKLILMGNVSVDRSMDPMKVTYNKTLVPYGLINCHVVEDDFYVHPSGLVSPGILNTSLDLFSWTFDQLMVVFHSVTDWSPVVKDCVLKSFNEFINNTLFCKNNYTNLAAFYNPSFPPRSDSIQFLNGNASVVICNAGQKGFFVADYRPDLIPLTPSTPITPSPTSSQSFNSTEFNLIWLAPLVVGSALLLGITIKYTSNKIKMLISNCYHRLQKAHERPLLELTKDTDNAYFYNSTS